MRELTPDMLGYIADECCRGPESKDEIVREFFATEHFAKIMDGFDPVNGAYHPYYPFLFCVARMLEPDYIVELGVELGRGLISMHRGWPESPIVGVDMLPVTGPATYVAPAAIEGRWSLIEGTSMEFHRRHPRQMIGLLHIDSTHDYETCHEEWMAYRPQMHKGGIVAFDDLNGVRRVWDEDIVLPFDLKVDLPELHPGMGFGVVICDSEDAA